MARGLNMATPAIALLATLAVAGFTHREQIGKALGDALGSKPDGQNPATGTPASAFGTGFGGNGGLGNILGGLGGMLGGAGTGGVLKDGLDGLLDRFRQTGHGDEAESWVKDGPNRTIDPQVLERALGSQVVDHLQSQTGLARDELLRRLSTNLPQTVDTLTPQGRLPTEEEANGFSSSV
ncbi:MAG: hypothetical protein JWQ89_933 [Devosia sp.]|uniref:YidB family protein n=1 Tax=Devosia sp. TaxID=1871048 RepID=UPI002616AD56|nr:YidB family protein [Devosia sp.]MDB5539206.1 hypothetical protein [Devosia sp.]